MRWETGAGGIVAEVGFIGLEAGADGLKVGGDARGVGGAAARRSAGRAATARMAMIR